MELGPIRARIRGPQGTAVQVEVQRSGEGAPLSFTITREPIAFPAEEHRLLERQIGYLRFFDFHQGSASQIARAINELQGQQMRGLVLDLRSNTGGLDVELNAVANMLLTDRSLAYTDVTRRGKVPKLTQGTPLLPPGVPLMVLVDEVTRSAAEVVAAALRDNGRAQVVGVKTAGAVLYERFWRLPDDAGIAVAVARTLSPKGVELEGNGVTPDVVIEMSADDLDRGIDTQLRRALDMIQPKSLRRPEPTGRAYPDGWSKETRSRLMIAVPAVQAVQPVP